MIIQLPDMVECWLLALPTLLHTDTCHQTYSLYNNMFQQNISNKLRWGRFRHVYRVWPERAPTQCTFVFIVPDTFPQPLLHKGGSKRPEIHISTAAKLYSLLHCSGLL